MSAEISALALALHLKVTSSPKQLHYDGGAARINRGEKEKKGGDGGLSRDTLFIDNSNMAWLQRVSEVRAAAERERQHHLEFDKACG